MGFEIKRKLGANEAMAQICMMEQEAQVMGAQDYEPGAFSALKQSLLEGEISPEEAMRKAREILNSKQDYH